MNPHRQITPITQNARSFCEKYGYRFHILSMMREGLSMSLRSLDTGRIVQVSRGDDGIMVDGGLFCKEW